MSFLYLAIHHPYPEHREELLTAMDRLGAALAKVPGMQEARAWAEKDGNRIVATSVWESEETFLEALSVISGAVKDVPFAKWEARPRELYRLRQTL